MPTNLQEPSEVSSSLPSILSQINDPTRRGFLKNVTVSSLLAATGLAATPVRSLGKETPSTAKNDKANRNENSTFESPPKRTAAVQTVLGPIEPTKLGATLTHEHAPIVDWSELYEVPPAPFDAIKSDMLERTVKLLTAFEKSLPEGWGPGAIVECTPIRVGRYPHLMVELAKRTKAHLVACTGFWCEAMAPQHPWAVRMSVSKDGVRALSKLFIREIMEGMEDPAGAWGERFTKVRAGIVKCATSTYLRPSERALHIAAAIASRETGCPITTHTTNGGGLEQVQLFLKQRVKPEKIVIGHQGNMDDREKGDAHEYHRRLANLGCYLQFDRVGHKEYAVEKQAQQIKRLIDAGFVKQVLVSHDHVPYFYPGYVDAKKTAQGWKGESPDFTICTTQLKTALQQAGVTEAQLKTIYVDNPARMLSFS